MKIPLSLSMSFKYVRILDLQLNDLNYVPGIMLGQIMHKNITTNPAFSASQHLMSSEETHIK